MPSRDDSDTDSASDWSNGSSTDSSTSPPDSSISSGTPPSDNLDDLDTEIDTLLLGQDGAAVTGAAASTNNTSSSSSSAQRRHRLLQQQKGCRAGKHFCRATSLGDLKGFTDKMLLMLAQLLKPRDLVHLGYVSWMFLVVAHDEPTWRRLVLLYCIDRKEKIAKFCYHGSWRRTMMHPRRFPNKRYDEQDVAPPTTSRRGGGGGGGGGDAAMSSSMLVATDAGEPACWMIQSPHRPRWARLRKTDYEKWYDNRTYPPEKATMYLGGIDRRENLTYLDFVEQYERPNRPVILTDAARDWPARKKWTVDGIVDNYGDTLLRVGLRSTKGYRFRIRIFDHMAYCHTANAEKYMYVFDKKIIHKHGKLKDDYHVPVYFSQDLFNLMEDDERPDYKWLLIGPNGSGSPHHTDPHATSAWNCVLAGAKRVSFYPPNVLPPGVDPKLIDSDVYPSDDMQRWYRWRLPRQPPERRPVECVVLPGEMLFIPSGWWHSVMNIGTTIAVTQNYCSLQTFPFVAHDMNRSSGKQIRKDFKCALAESQYKPLADYIIVNKKRAAAMPTTTTANTTTTTTTTAAGAGEGEGTSNQEQQPQHDDAAVTSSPSNGAVDDSHQNVPPPPHASSASAGPDAAAVAKAHPDAVCVDGSSGGGAFNRLAFGVV